MNTAEIIVRVITPADGKVLTNGEVYSVCVYLGAEDTPDRWYEVDPPDEWGVESN